ncbi:MAG: hypothetical protein WCF22_23900 [Candidatus Sulfotelmatobacter sp.]
MMRSQKTFLPLLVALVLGLAPSGFGQLASQAHSRQSTHSWYNPATGTYEPLRPMVEADAVPEVAPTTGTLTFKYTITVKSAIPTNAVISCEGDVDTSEATGFFVEDGASGIATGSGSAWTCTAVIHYSWSLTTPTTDTLILGGSVTMEYGYQATATNGSGIIVVPAVARTNTHTIPSMKVPASGAATTVNVAVTL